MSTESKIDSKMSNLLAIGQRNKVTDASYSVWFILMYVMYMEDLSFQLSGCKKASYIMHGRAAGHFILPPYSPATSSHEDQPNNHQSR